MPANPRQTASEPSLPSGLDLRKTVIGNFAVIFVAVVGVEACRYLTLPIITTDAQLLMLIDGGLLALVAALVIHVARNILGRIAQIADNFGGAADDITRTSSRMNGMNLLLADSAAEQAARLAEAAAALDLLSHAGDRTAQLAQGCASLSLESQAAVDQGVRAVERLTRAAAGVVQAAAESGALIEQVNDLACRVNLLALSAAVEAARAGQRGRGFAAVAEEMRTVSLDLGAIAGDAGRLIGDHAEAGHLGSAAAGDVVKSLQAIVETSTPVRDGLAGVANDAADNAGEASKLARAVSRINHVVQQGAIDAAESANASHELAGQARAFGIVVRDLGRTAERSRSFKQPPRLRPAPLNA